jgi:antitoxin ParD1/3/4
MQGGRRDRFGRYGAERARLDQPATNGQVGHRYQEAYFVPNLSLNPEQQSFIESRVASGRFASASEVMRHALRLMQEAEDRRERFVAMLCDVSERAEREGTLSAEQVDDALQAVIAAAKRPA